MTNATQPQTRRPRWLGFVIIGLCTLIFGATLLYAAPDALTPLISVAVLSIFSALTLVSAFVEIAVGIKILSDFTDRIIWTISGVSGTILGFLILNAGNFAAQETFVRLFGTYLMIFGGASLIFGAHQKNRALAREELATRLAREQSKKRQRAARAAHKSVAKSVRKTAKSVTKNRGKKKTTQKS